MSKEHQKKRSLFQQTVALLWKNILLKWRMRMQTFQELFSSVSLLASLIIVTIIYVLEESEEIPRASLGQLDDPAFNITGTTIFYTPDTKLAREVMKKIETTSVMQGIKTELVRDEKALETALHKDALGVVFQDDVSYRLRFPAYRVPWPDDLTGNIDFCYNYSSPYCSSPKYWFEGFVSLQSSIDSALIEQLTNHSVWDEMKSISGIRMRSPFITPTYQMEICVFFFAVIVCFSPFMYFLSQNVSREKRKLKEVMKTMGLRDTAFWLSWGILYAVYIVITSCVLASFLNNWYFTCSSFFALFLLFFIYGISSISFCFMISSILKKPKETSFVVFILIFFFGGLSILLLVSRIPAPLEWILSIFCPFAFGAGIIKISLYQKYGKAFNVTEVMMGPCPYVLFLDSVLYMLLALYFDRVVADKYGVPYSPFFFLKKSYWFKSRNRLLGDVSTNERRSIFSDNVEPMPPEFDGKDAIRLNNIKKTYEVKRTKTEALRGLSLNIYEGQITAILGHSGAGKTTLLHILSGLSKQSDVKENLKTFAKIKGILSNDIEKEVQTLLTLLDIDAIQDTQASCLSGGQKRKLSLAITFLGEPQVLFLDEPTAGLDPYSRQQVWSLLNERKAGRVILFTTQFMDEADILANRKAFISYGKLTCVGSSLFLKKKWGIGYHLRMHINEFCDSERTTSLVKQHIPDARLSGQRENELSYTLPLENMDKFPALFCDMDHQTDLGIVNYGVTMTTLEDVFLKLEGNEMIDEEDYRGHREEQMGEGRKGEVEQDQLLLSDTGKATIRGMALWRQQVCGIARMHFLNLKRKGKVWGSLLLLLGIMLSPLILQATTIGIWVKMHKAELHPGLYFEPGKQLLTGTSGLLILNDTGASIDNLIHAVKSQNIQLDVVSGSNVSDQLVHSGAIKVAMKDKKYRFTVMCHMEVINCFPVLINIISNAFLQMSNSTAHLRLWNHAYLEIRLTQGVWFYFFQGYIVAAVLLFPAFPPNFSMTSIRDYKIKTWSQLRVSGIFPSAYWCGQALIDIPLHCILYALVFWPCLLQIYTTNGKTIATLIFFSVSFLFGYSISLILFLYVIAFIFRKKSHPSSFWSFILILVTLMIIIIRFFIYMPQIINYLDYLLTFLVPIYPAITFLDSYTGLQFFHEQDEEFKYKKKLWMSSFVPYLHSVIFIFLLCYLVTKYGKPVMRRDPVFRISPQKKSIQQNPEEPSEKDRDVEDERARVQSVLGSTNQEEKPVVIVHNLRKEYKSRKICSCLKKNKTRRKVATRTVSFCVKKGEVLGLLGPNGAGKSTTISVITGDTNPTAGQVLIKGASAATMEENTGGFLGYCPQENALWSNLTVKEHLEIYASIKGIRKDAAAAAIDRIAQALELQEHFKKTIKTLPAGLVRKLCFALSMLGSPTVILFDEPTTGMDPKGKRQVWKAIHSVLKDQDQGAILTTHHMEEAEAVCDRVAIMVSGQLRCLGSIQYLKSKFGKNYLLQIKVRGVEEGEFLNTQILQIFPHAARQERISTLLVYKVPMEDALPLSKAFSMLEEAKQSFNLEEYSFSLNTLEQDKVERAMPFPCIAVEESLPTPEELGFFFFFKSNRSFGKLGQLSLFLSSGAIWSDVQVYIMDHNCQLQNLSFPRSLQGTRAR
ncbi:ABC-type organic anion transporter ABCA8-like isoform X2 [Sceloporus undulatus]|uniref:ABC-type organic anion transporter ABCA8-like isoform X2 n=1 Tax=Sceloporus undulatus TaxID=8520 RepID=UPI001C4B5CBC|nr:ABC-type organic anion transporter ABCA8-like isoform X2 [Sceloporus undulatus]